MVSVGEPVAHRKADNIEGKYGVWMQDPEAVSPYGPNMVWRIDTIGKDVRKLFGYDDMEQLSKGFPSKVGFRRMIFIDRNNQNLISLLITLSCFPMTGPVVARAGGEHWGHSVPRLSVFSETSQPHPHPLRLGLGERRGPS